MSFTFFWKMFRLEEGHVWLKLSISDLPRCEHQEKNDVRKCNIIRVEKDVKTTLGQCICALKKM